MKVLLHHHAGVFRDAEGSMHLPAFLGKWVDCMAEHVAQIGLLLPQTTEKQAHQDHVLTPRSNLHLHALPTGGRRWDFFQRRRRIAQICREVSGDYDLLLVRGITPRQWTVWQNCRTVRKAFLLVGSLRENRPPFGWQPDVFFTWLMLRIRKMEFGKICRQPGALLLANSPHLVTELRVGQGAEPFFASTNTIAGAQIPPFQFREIHSPVRLLFTGRVVRDKGVEDLLHALALLPETYTLRIVGGVAPKYQAYLNDMASGLGIGKQVEWAGFIPFGETLLAEYGRADVYVLPSWHEGFPHSLWEAAAMSTPVLTTPVGGIPGLVDESMVTFVRPRDPADLARGIENVVKDQTERHKKAAKLHAHSYHYHLENGVKRLLELMTA
ncbi:MAG: glycosyltransferase family 4 protein [Saprospiraceae bacterium]|nr:glycosyltransferase family 4 protein [Saprospiraceae bacterium]